MSDGKPVDPASQDATQQPPAGEEDVSAKRESLRLRELAALAREEAVELREHTAGDRETLRVAAQESETVARERDGALTAREEAANLREDALRAREAAAQARLEVDQLNTQLRDANERLVVATVKAQGAEEDAKRANRLKDEFLATVSHEIRTPLNAVLGWARMLSAQQVTGERAAHAIETIERNASALAYIVDDLLDVSRIIAGTLHLTREPVDLVATTQAAIEAVRPLAAAKSIELGLSSDPLREPVSGDAARLQQVVWNLLSNAIKFTPPGGRVDVSIRGADSTVEVAVADTGEGISPEFLPHVFERFRQADAAASRRHQGLGLGLTIVRQLVELHDGTVHAASPGLGQGAIFTVRLPILTSAVSIERWAPLERRAAPNLSRLDGVHILLVEDHADSRELMSAILERAGASVTAVKSAKEAFQAIKTRQPNALVSDIGLPGEDGYALIRRLRRVEEKHGGFLPAVAITGYVSAEDRARVLEAGYQAHVPKPVDPVELTAAIATITHHLRDSEP